jgi:hypothetical protein
MEEVRIRANGGKVTVVLREGISEMPGRAGSKGEVTFSSRMNEDADRQISRAYAHQQDLFPVTGMERRIVTAALIAYRASERGTIELAQEELAA